MALLASSVLGGVIGLVSRGSGGSNTNSYELVPTSEPPSDAPSGAGASAAAGRVLGRGQRNTDAGSAGTSSTKGSVQV